MNGTLITIDPGALLFWQCIGLLMEAALIAGKVIAIGAVVWFGIWLMQLRRRGF